MRTLPRPLGWFLCALLVLALYWPTLSAEALWDDNHFIFWRYAFGPLPSFAVIWKTHFWPLYDTVVTSLYALWGSDFILWRGLGLCLHWLNACWLAWLISRWRRDFYWPVFVLFLIHPLNVMSVALIIQLKTLLSFLFLLATATCLYWADRRAKYWPALLGALAFFFSVMSKSSSLPFPFVALASLFFLRLLTRQRFLLLLPVFVVAGLAAIRINTDWVFKFRSETFEERTIGAAPTKLIAPVAPPTPTVKETPLPAPAVSAPPRRPPKKKVVTPRPLPVAAVVQSTVPPADSRPARFPPPPLKPLKLSKTMMVFHNFGEYALYPVYPWPLSVSHGRFTGTWSWRAVAGLAVFATALGWAILRRRRGIIVLLAGYALGIAPFLGIVFAPYMSYTAVSEQHLYLVLPFALCLLLLLLKQLKDHAYKEVVSVYVVFLCALTAHYAASYTNEVNLFRRVLQERPADLFAHMNLAEYYQRVGLPSQTKRVMSAALDRIEADPGLRREPIYPQFIEAWKIYGLE